MSSAERGEMSFVETGLISAAETGQMVKPQIGRLALNHQKCFEMGPEWLPGPENRSPGMPLLFPTGTSLAAKAIKDRPKGNKKYLFGVSRWDHFKLQPGPQKH